MNTQFSMPWALTLIAACFAFSACGNNDNNSSNPSGDETPDAGDSTPDTTGTDETGDQSVTEPVVTYETITCPTPVPVAQSGLCDVTAGDATKVMIRGNILADGKVYEGGSIVVDRSSDNGTISCVGCDCDAGTATVLSCANAVVSPGLINAHDHITFNSKGAPKPHGDERFDHRHDWRTGRGESTRIRNNGSANGREALLFAELRHVMAGTTSMAGAGGTDGFLRDLDRSSQGGLPGGFNVENSTFPLGDTFGDTYKEGCDHFRIDGEDVFNNTAYLPHVSEGINDEARNEFFCLSGTNGTNYIREKTAIIHGIGVSASDIGEMANVGAKLIWSPRSNMDLYGQTADVMTYNRQGVTIGMGTDWVISGSMNMLRELRCADELNTKYYKDYFNDYQLWLMATTNNAQALGVDAQIGRIATNQVADIAIYDATGKTHHRGVLDAQSKDVALVLRGGNPLYGRAQLVDALLPSEDQTKCEAIEVCGTSQKLCAQLDTTLTLAEIRTGAGTTNYDLFYCDTPVDEPSCVPLRPNEYSGAQSPADQDGDGVVNEEDNCPSIFNPRRPLNQNVQPNEDNDSLGDACDLCVFNDGTPCMAFQAGDIDSDGIATDMDNCPFKSNPNQEDADSDGTGDVCDACPDAPNPDGAGCPATVYEIKQNKFPVSTRIGLSNVVVSGSGTDGFFLQVPSSSPQYSGVEDSGVFVFARDLEPKPSAGDVISINATVTEYQEQVQLAEISATDITVTSQGTPPAPVDVTLAEIVHTGSKGKSHEGVLIRVQNTTVEEVDAENMKFTLEGNVAVDNILFAVELPTVGDTFTSITGPVSFRFGQNHIAPRDADDLSSGPAKLQGVSSMAAYIEANTTLSDALVVTLTSAAQQDVTVNLSYLDANILTGPASITITAGNREGTASLQGVLASATPQTISATYDGDTQTTQLTVFDDATPRVVATLESARSAVQINQSIPVTVSLNLPAPSTGAVVNLSNADGLLTIPASVMVASGDLSATFMAMTQANTGSATLSATIGAAAAQTLAFTISTLPDRCLVISEYAEASAAKIVEIYNCGAQDIDLTKVGLCLISNANTTCSSKTNLTGMLTSGEVSVVCKDQASSPACTQTSSVANFNGNDRLLLFDDPNTNKILDANETILDSFGQTTAAVADDTWADVVYRRCNLTPFDGLSAFDVSTFYVALPGLPLDLSNLGVAPSMTMCP